MNGYIMKKIRGKYNVTVSMDEQTYQKLRAIAYKEDITMQEVIRRMIKRSKAVKIE